MNLYFDNKKILSSPLINRSHIFLNDSKKVYDEIRGYLATINNEWVFLGVTQYKKTQKHHLVKRLALVLESPHQDEYSTKNTPLRPAAGITGQNINKLLTKMIETEGPNLLEYNKVYSVRLVNIIQYQCSLFSYGYSNSTLKTKVLSAFFKNKGWENDFIHRLKKYKPTIIINACTSKLKKEVGKVISDHFKKSLKDDNLKILTTTHPSNWSQKYR